MDALLTLFGSLSAIAESCAIVNPRCPFWILSVELASDVISRWKSACRTIAPQVWPVSRLAGRHDQGGATMSGDHDYPNLARNSAERIAPRDPGSANSIASLAGRPLLSNIGIPAGSALGAGSSSKHERGRTPRPVAGGATHGKERMAGGVAATGDLVHGSHHTLWRRHR